MKRLFMVLGVLLSLSILVTGCAKSASATKSKEEKLKVGFIYIGPATDGGYTYTHDQGRAYLEKELGVETVVRESVKEDKAEVERVVEDMVEQGCTLIVGTSFGFQDGLLSQAKKHPNVKFLHYSGYEMAENMGQAFPRIYEGRYLSGIVAGMKTKSNTIGFVGAFPIPEVIRSINAFTLGVQSVNPAAKVKVVWTNTWYDPAKEKDAAIALIDSGADVIAQHQNTAGPQQAAESRGVFSIGYNTDMSSAAPKANLTSVVWNMGPYYVKQAESLIKGTWKSAKYWGGLSENVVGLAPLTSLAPQGAQEAIDKAKADILSGKNKVFQGPIKDQTGTLRVEAGKSMTDDEMWNMDWFVEGVEGTIPKN